MSEKFFLELNLFFESEKEAGIVFDAVKNELIEERKDRSRTEVRVKKNIFSIHIKAKDKTALKASLNSLLKSVALSFSLIGG